MAIQTMTSVPAIDQTAASLSTIVDEHEEQPECVRFLFQVREKGGSLESFKMDG